MLTLRKISNIENPNEPIKVTVTRNGTLNDTVNKNVVIPTVKVLRKSP